MKLKYLIQVNQLYLADDLKQVINQEEQQKQTQISVSAQIKWKYYKNEYNDKILNLIFKAGFFSHRYKIIRTWFSIRSAFQG